MAEEDIKPGRAPTGPEAQSIPKKARAGHLPEGFVEGELAAMGEQTGDEVRAVGSVEDTDSDNDKGKKELSPEQVWFDQFKARFELLSKLHEGVQWADVERSLKADPDSMVKLQALDEKGHAMNVFGEEDGEFIFVSAWNDVSEVAVDHRNIAYDPDAQILTEKNGYSLNGNAVSILAKIMGVGEDVASNYLADPKFNEELRQAVALKGWAWLKPDAATKKAGRALCGDGGGVRRNYANFHDDHGSFRAALRVKKV